MHLKVDNKTLNPVSDTNNVWKNTHHALQRYAIQPHIHRRVHQALRLSSLSAKLFSTPLTFGDLARALNENRQRRHWPATFLYRTNSFPIHPIVQSVLLRAHGKVTLSTMKKRASASLFSLSLSSALCISAFLSNCR